MTEMTTTRLPHTNYIGRLETPREKGNEKTILVSYTTLNHASKNGKVPTTAVGTTKSN